MIVYLVIGEKSQRWMEAFEIDYQVQMWITFSWGAGCHLVEIYGPRSKELLDKLVEEQDVEYHGLTVTCINSNSFD